MDRRLRVFYIRMTLWYLEAMLPGMAAALGLFLCLWPWRKRRLAAAGLSSAGCREAAMVLLWLFSGGMAALTLLPSDWVNPLANLRYGLPFGPFFSPGSVNLVPFATLELGHQTRFTRYILLGNIFMFVPFGFFASLLWREYTWKRALGTGFAVTGLIECWQLCIGRAFDIDDLLLNALGVLCGFWICTTPRRRAADFAGTFQVRPCKE